MAILAKSTTPNPKLEGTIYTAAEQIIKSGGQALPIPCDIRYEDQVKSAIEQVVNTFGGIDILINNASAISLTPTLDTDMKRYDLMNSINTRGTFLLSKYCIPHLLKSSNPHILTLSPPPTFNPMWYRSHVAYTIAKMGMTLVSIGLADEYKGQIGVNTLWPRTMIATAAVRAHLGGEESIRRSRLPVIMADAAYAVLTSDAKVTGGNFYIDDELVGGDLLRYNVDPKIGMSGLMPDGFID